MAVVTNESGIPLPLAVWAVHDDYDYISDPNYISVTRLMKPLRQIILAKRMPSALRKQMDVQDLIASSWGSALHHSIENAWMNYPTNLAKLGYPEEVISRIKINPSESEIEPNTIPVYMERRGTVQLGKWKLGGKFDFVAEGIVQDFKSTSAYAWTIGGKDGDYSLQGSLYRLIHQNLITEDYIRINFLFTDWRKADARSNPNYPQSRLASKDISLMSVRDAEIWALNKLSLIEKFMDAPEDEIPECTDEELWKGEDKFKYYADPAKADTPGARSTKNFESLAEGMAYWKVEKGGKGILKVIPATPKRCEYCDVFAVCTQKDRYSFD